MGTGWRRAFCTTIPKSLDAENDNEKQTINSPSPRSCGKFGFLTGKSNPSTPRLSRSLRCSTTADGGSREATYGNEGSNELIGCKTTTSKSAKSNPTSPHSPLQLSLFRNSFKFRGSCGICSNSVKTGRGTAIYTAECSHAFHFPCVAEHVRKHNSLACPVCNTKWNDLLLLAAQKNPGGESRNDAVTGDSAQKPGIEDKKVIESYLPSVISGGGGLEPQPKPSVSRSYDDDEPLVTPRFVPILEADENEEEEDEDGADNGNDGASVFQGFVVNPSPPFASNGRDFNNVQVEIMPESAVLSVGGGHDTYAVALSVKAPPNVRSQRAPIDLVTVLDLSMNMSGAKLQMLKRAMRLVISSLGSADRLSIVAFSSSPKRLLPLKRMTARGQCAARQVVDRIVCGQGYSAGDALRKATKVLEDRRERNPTASIVLLSDGQDEAKRKTHQRQKSSRASSPRFENIEIPVYSTGFGETGGSSHEPAVEAFAKRVRRLLSLVAHDLRIQLGVLSGSSPCEISGVYLCDGNPTVVSSGSVRLGDLYAGEEREIMVELKVPRSSAVGSHHVLSVRCLYKDPSTQQVAYGRDQALLVPRPHAVRSSSPKIGRLRGRFVATRAIAESRRLAEFEDLAGAYHLLTSARALLMQTDAGEEARKVEGELAEIQWRRQQRDEVGRMIGRLKQSVGENAEASAWKAAEKLAKVAMMKKSMSKVSDLHGFENARF